MGGGEEKRKRQNCGEAARKEEVKRKGRKTDDNQDGQKEEERRELFRVITKINNKEIISKQNKLIKSNDIQIEIIFSSLFRVFHT